MDRTERVRELERLRGEVARLEAELVETPLRPWAPSEYYTAYHVLAGMVLGFIGACASLLFNIIGAPIAGEAPFQLVKVYMTFPLGARALEINDGFAVAGGCGLYLCTGAFLGIPIHMMLSRFFASSSGTARFMAVTVAGMALWVINFYVLLSWIQPALIGGNWIVEMIPWWVGLATHLAFVWTLLLVDRWGAFNPPAASAIGPGSQGKAQ